MRSEPATQSVEFRGQNAPGDFGLSRLACTSPSVFLISTPQYAAAAGLRGCYI